MTILTAILWCYPYFMTDQTHTFIQDWLYDELGLTTDHLMLLLIGLCIALLSLLRLAGSQSSDVC
jgi:hypothetical protein